MLFFVAHSHRCRRRYSQVAVAVLNNGLRPDIPEWCPREFSSLIQVGACFDGVARHLAALSSRPCLRFLDSQLILQCISTF